MKQSTLTQGSILRALIGFAFPVLLALFLQAMYGAADLIIVGQFAGTYEQSGVATGGQLFHLITMVVTGLSTGVTVIVGNAIGAQNRKRANAGVASSIAIFAALAIIITVVTVPFARPLAQLLRAPEEAFTQTSSYLRICGIGTVFIVAYNVIGAIFRGIGDSKTPLLTVAIACVVNIFGDLILVGPLQMGAAGAAIATTAAQGISVLVSLYFIRKKELPFVLRLRNVQFSISRDILRIGLPVGLQEMMVAFSFVFIQAVVNSTGVVASAAVGLSERVCGFLMLTASAYMQAISAFVAQNNGAGAQARSRKALLYGMETAFLIGLVMSALAFFGGDLLAAVFSREADVISAAHEYLKAYALDCLLTAILFCFIGYFNGCGYTVFSMVQGVVGAFCVRVPAVYLISRLEGVTLFHIGLATPLSSVVQIILFLFAYRTYRRRELRTAQLAP